MRRLWMIACTFVTLATLAGTAHAGSDGRKGTSGASELLIPVGGRGNALGSSVVSDVSGVEGLFWNPAGISRLTGTEAQFSHTQYFADMNVNYAAVATSPGGWGTLGFSAKVLSIGEILVTTEAAPDGTGEILEPTFTVLGVTWAKQFTDRVNFGVTTNFVSEKILDTSANGVAFDFGVQYDTGWNGLRLGVVMKNFGTSMQYSGPGFDVSQLPPGSDPSSAPRISRFTSSSFEMPSYFTLAATYDVVRMRANHFKLMGSFQSNNFFGDNFTGGAEWGLNDVLMLRGSYFGTMANEIDATTGDESIKFDAGDDLYSGYALGAGLNVKAGGAALGFDVAWRPVKNFFDDTIEAGLRLKF